MLLPLTVLLAPALADGELEILGQAGALGGHVYLGAELLVGSPEDEGRPGYRPLAGPAPLSLPEDLAAFEVVGEQCDTRAERALAAPGPSGRRVAGLVDADLDGDGQPEQVRLEVDAPPEDSLLPYAPLTVSVWRGGAPVAERTLEVTAFPCDLRVQDVSADGAPEIIVIWRSAGGSGYTQGATVLSI